jgi:bcr-type benzoyl-CoA reductase subunit C
MDPFKRIKEIVADPYAYARTWKKEKGGLVIGHFCSYTPVELIASVGALPFRIFPGKDALSLADAHLQAYCCNPVRGALEEALRGRLDFLEGAAFPHTCDSMMRLSDIWRLNAGFPFHADVILPVKTTGESAAEYSLAVLQRFKKDLERHFKRTLTTEKLGEVLRVYNRIRRGLERLYRLRSEDPFLFGGGGLLALTQAAGFMDPYDLAEEVEGLVERFEKEGPQGRSRVKRLILSGGMCLMPDLFQALEGLGARVVWDDFCTGARYVEGGVEEEGDPLQALSRRYLQRVVCPAKHAGLRSRGEYLMEKVKEHRADGVLLFQLKFCDPHAFDYPYIKGLLDEAGVPHVHLEIEDPHAFGGPLRTRCEAFLEML